MAILAAAVALSLVVVAPTGAASGPTIVELETVASGLTAPVGLTHAGDGSGRLFIVEQTGQIRFVEDGTLLAAPFLDISGLLPTLNPFFDERGLLGVAFHPAYEGNGRFYVRYSVPRSGDPGEPCFGTSRGCHSEVLAEYRVSAGDPNVADPSSGLVLFTVDEPQFNHDAGEVAFGPDGFLYFTLGDGGGAHDGLADMPPSHGPIGNGQNIEPLLGSMLRIDVDSAFPYAIPPDNPFVGAAGRDEIYAYGLRNPYRFSFDDGPGGDGRLFLADVGQNLFEEVDIVEKGGNYGWVIREGFH
ncbi:MAG: PQQ-dependent sugar dehydrogenase, partial [Gammaproteobacteria bacterium]|nr:PQQ-dependent sugar dehydrogenase [Gammaproteobacteria bacterium]